VVKPFRYSGLRQRLEKTSNRSLPRQRSRNEWNYRIGTMRRVLGRPLAPEDHARVELFAEPLNDPIEQFGCRVSTVPAAMARGNRKLRSP